MSDGDINQRLVALESAVGKMRLTGMDLLKGGGLFIRKVVNVPNPGASPPDGRIWHLGSNLFARLNGVTETLAVQSLVLLKSLFAAKGDIVAGTGASTVGTLTVGADDTILMADTAAATGLKWVASASPSAVGTAAAVGTSDTFTRGDHVHAHEAAHINHDTTWAAKGDLIAATANDTAAVLTVGANTTILMADSTQTTGTKWQATPGKRYFDLVLVSAGGVAPTWASDAHGSLSGNGAHIDIADNTDLTLRFAALTLPADYSSTLALEICMSAAAGGGNFVFDVDMGQHFLNAAGSTDVMSLVDQVFANHASADRFTIHSNALENPPSAVSPLNTTITINGANASDTIGAQRTFWGARISYVPTL